MIIDPWGVILDCYKTGGGFVMADIDLERLEKEEGLEIKSYEVWHDEKNAKMMDECAKDKCEGVPFLFNTETKDFVCGEADYERIKEWAKGKT